MSADNTPKKETQNFKVVDAEDFLDFFKPERDDGRFHSSHSNINDLIFESDGFFRTDW